MSTDSEQPAAAGPDMRGGGPRWLKRLLIGSGLLVLLLVVGAVLAVVNRTSLLAWAVETYLEDDTFKSVSLSAESFDTEQLHIRNLRLAGDNTITVKNIRLDYDLESVFGGTINKIQATGIRSERTGSVITVKEIVGAGRFDSGPGGPPRLQAGLDILHLQINEHPFEPGRIEFDFENDRLAVEAAIGAADGFLTFIGNGPLGEAPDGFKMHLSGRINAAPLAALVGGSTAASGPISVVIAGTTADPFSLLQEEDPKNKQPPNPLSLTGHLELALKTLRIGDTELPTGGTDRIDFALTDFKATDKQTTTKFAIGVAIAKRDAPTFGFDRATLKFAGKVTHTPKATVVSIGGGDLVTLRNLRVADGGPVNGDMSLALTGHRNTLTARHDKETLRHQLQGKLTWNAGTVTLQSEGDLNAEADPLVLTLRGEFDATPFLALQPALKDATGKANLFLAGRISQVLDLLADRKPDRDWAGSVRLDGAFKLDLSGFQIPDMAASGTPKDSLEITLKGFNGSGGHQRGKLALTAMLDGRRSSGIRFAGARLALDGRLDIGSKGITYVPASDSALAISKVSFDNGFAVPDGVTFQLTGIDNHLTIAPTLDGAEHKLTFAHLEIDGLFDAGHRKQQPIRITIPRFGSEKTGSQPYHFYATGGALELPTLQINANGINLSIEQRPDEIQYGLEAADVRHTGRPPQTKPLAISAKGKMRKGIARATLLAKQRHGPVSVRGRLKHKLSSGAGRLDFEMPTVTLTPDTFTLADLYPPAEKWFDTALGKASAKGHLLWDKDVLSGQMSVKLNDVQLVSDEFGLKDVNGSITFIELIPLVMPPRQRLKGLVSYGELGPMPAQLEFQLQDDGKIAIQDLDLTLAGGHLNTRGLLQTDKELSAKAAIGVRAVDLKELLQLIGVEGLKGTGKLSGSIPIRITGGNLVIRDGKLRALGPGRLRYGGSALEKQLSARKDTAGTVSKVLSDFHYQKLTMRLDKQAKGLGTIMLQMEGSNPAVYKGHPFAFNIRIESDFDKLGRIAFGGAQTFSEALKKAQKSTEAE